MSEKQRLSDWMDVPSFSFEVAVKVDEAHRVEQLQRVGRLREMLVSGRLWGAQATR